MTLTDAIALLDDNRIPFQTARYESETAYWQHCVRFPYTKNARNCKVTVLVIPSINGRRDIELQFNRIRGLYRFEDLRFGGYSFEMSDHDPELLAGDILDIIGQIVDGKLTVIEVNDLKKKRWRSTLCFDPTDTDAVFGGPGLRDALKKIEGPKTFWQKLRGSKIQYDIYDWRTCRQIVK